MLLSRQLVSNYEQSRPDLVSVVLESSGFNDLLDNITYLRDAQKQQQTIIRSQAGEGARERRRRSADRSRASVRQITLATSSARPRAGQDEHAPSLTQGALAGARIAQQSALAASRARAPRWRPRSAIFEPSRPRPSARRRPSSPLARRWRWRRRWRSGGSGAPTPVGPTLWAGGGWAIPYAIVTVRVGRSEPDPQLAPAPRATTRSCPAPGRLFGGNGPAAYLASKSAQDSGRGRIWNGGAGASNWVCAGIVGIH